MKTTQTLKVEDVDVVEPYLVKNYSEYLDSVLRIGFTQSFPEKTETIVDEILFETKLNNKSVVSLARLCKASFGQNKEFEVNIILTDSLEKYNKLIGGLGSHLYADTAKIMEQAIVALAQKHDLIIYEKVCSWPFAKAIVGELTEAHKNSI